MPQGFCFHSAPRPSLRISPFHSHASRMAITPSVSLKAQSHHSNRNSTFANQSTNLSFLLGRISQVSPNPSVSLVCCITFEHGSYTLESFEASGTRAVQSVRRGWSPSSYAWCLILSRACFSRLVSSRARVSFAFLSETFSSGFYTYCCSS